MRKLSLILIIFSIFIAKCAYINVHSFPKIESYELNYSSYTITIGEHFQLRSIATPYQATLYIKSCESSNPNIATVDNFGKVVGVGEGNCVITVLLSNNKTLSCDVTVEIILENEIYLDVEYTTIPIGYSETINARVYPNNATFKNVKWKSSDPTVVSVFLGEITALKEGTAKITATTYHGTTKSVDITVSKNILPSSISIRSSYSLKRNSIVSFICSFTPEITTNKTLSWTSSNTEVATVDKDGIVYGLKAGTTIITATSANGKTATCHLTVY